MRKPRAYLAVLFIAFFLSSCKKEAKNNGEIEKPIEPVLELTKQTLSFSEFGTDEDIMDQIFLGNMFRVDTIDGDPRLQVEPFTKYTKLPVRISSGLYVGTSLELPSFAATRRYSEKMEKLASIYDKFIPGIWHPISDFKTLVVPFGFQKDILALLNSVKDSGKSDSKVSAGQSAIISFSNQGTYSIDMSLPKREELISMNEAKTLADANLYYVNTVVYGRTYMLVAKGPDSEQQLKETMGLVFSNKELNSLQKNILGRTTLFVYLRTGRSKEKLLLKATGEREIFQAMGKFVKAYEDTKNEYAYPVMYSLRSLRNSSKFKHSFMYEWYVPVAK